jgi:glycosyltransferase 2 family protein
MEAEEERERTRVLAELEAGDLPEELPRNDWRRTLARFVVSVAFLAVLVWRLPGVTAEDLVPEVTAATVTWLAIAVAVHVVAYLLQNLRWWQVTATLGVRVPYRRMLSHLLAGEFVSNALPTSFGGDVVRVVRLGRDAAAGVDASGAPRPAAADPDAYADAFAATSLERLTGWLVLPIISTTALLLVPEYRELGWPSTAAWITNGVTVLALLVILWAAGHERGAGRLVGRAGWRRYLGAVHLGIIAFRHHPSRVLAVLGAGLGFQFLQCVSVWAVARALDVPEVTLLAAMAFFPPTAIVQNLPLTLGGLGVREGAFVLFFGALGVADGQAIALGLGVYLVFVAASLAGAPAFALGGRRAGGAARGRPATDR